MEKDYELTKNFDFLNFDFKNYNGNDEEINKVLYTIEDEKSKSFLEKEATFCRYKNKIILYNKFIELFSILLEKVGIEDNPISYLFLIKFFLGEGIFSIDGNKFKVTCGASEEFPGYMGLPIIYGYGSCRNISAFASDILTRIGIDNHLLYGYVKIDNPIFENNDANHVVNVINYNGIYYGIDVSNGEIFKFLDEIRLKNMFKDKDVFFNNVPYTNLILTDVPVLDYSKRLKEYKESSLKGLISFDELNQMLVTMGENIAKNENCINNFQITKDKYMERILKK